MIGIMSVTVDRVLEDALCLSEESRILLTERLLESVPPDKGIFEAQTAVAIGRLRELESGTVKAIPSQEALRMVREAVLLRARRS
jgi:hypothetical protein